MPYTVLARRYRSTTFDDIIGQDHVAQTLKKAIESGRVAHAYLFCGTRGVGKTSMARILAKALNCESFKQPTPVPCNKCNSCLAIARGDDIDVIEIDAASNRGIDNIRDLISNAQYRPAKSRFKIYIIDEVHGLSKDAFNALLKVLEEPPEHVKFILATTEAEKVLPTILSRCQRYDFRNIPTREIAGHLKTICKQEKIEAEEDALILLAKAGAGSMRDALSLLDRMLSAGEKKLSVDLVERLLGLPKIQLIFNLADAIAANQVQSVLKQVSDLISAGLSVDALLGALVDHLRNLLIVRTCGAESDLVEVAGLSAADLNAQAGRFEPATLSQGIVILEELRRQIRQSQAGRALLDATLVRLSLADQFAPIDELLPRVEARAAAEPQKKNVEPPRPAPATMTASVAPPSPVVPAPELPNIEPIGAADEQKLWRTMLDVLSTRDKSLAALLGHGRLTGFEDGRAIIHYSAQHDSFVKRLNANGKKEIVRDCLTQLVGRPTGVTFAVDESLTPAPGEAPAAAAGAADTAQLREEVRRDDPLVAALVETLGAEILKVE